MKIKLKLQILLVVAASTIGCSLAITAIGFNRIRNAEETSHRYEQEVRGLTEIKASALSTIQLDPTSDDTKKVFSDAELNISRWSGVIAPTLSTEDQRENFAALIAAWNAYDQKSHQLIDLASRDAKTANEQVTALYHSDFQSFQSRLEMHTEEIGNLAQRADDDAHDTIERSFLINISVMAIGLVIVTGWILVFSRSIQRALSNVQLALQDASASLDLTRRVPIQNDDEVGQTAVAFNRLMDRIAKVMIAVRDSAESVSVASKQIASGNIDLSSRTEEQAASLEETAASMEELIGTVRQNAENARQASGLSASALEVASHGNQVVSTVVSTMSEINESSSKIADIIGIIEAIAFQTNILALNAAVEAARAGEQGRGFAVVAGEVRTLAQRSSTAAKEIKDLIDTSVSRVQTGTQLVDEAGATMQDVIAAVSRVTDIIGEIAAASDEQSKGIDQVGQAVTQMDEMTQQNAALVEQAAAAAHSLDEQATGLKSAVAAFRLGSGAAPEAAQAEQGCGRSAGNSALQLARGHMRPPVLSVTPKIAVRSLPKMHSTEDGGWNEF